MAGDAMSSLEARRIGLPSHVCPSGWHLALRRGTAAASRLAQSLFSSEELRFQTYAYGQGGAVCGAKHVQFEHACSLPCFFYSELWASSSAWAKFREASFAVLRKKKRAKSLCTTNKLVEGTSERKWEDVRAKNMQEVAKDREALTPRRKK